MKHKSTKEVVFLFTYSTIPDFKTNKSLKPQQSQWWQVKSVSETWGRQVYCTKKQQVRVESRTQEKSGRYAN